MSLIRRAVAAVFIVLALALAGSAAFFVHFYPKGGSARHVRILPTTQRTERGRYLVDHVAACLVCHSARNWDEFAAPVIPGTEGKGGERFGRELGFPGTFYAPNITPAALGDWTDGEILRATTSGVARMGTALFPLMPYRSYNALSQEDAEAIVVYLRTLAPIPSSVPPSEPDFPMSVWVRTLPEPWVPQPDPDRAADGEYLVTIAACARCHTPTDRGEPVVGMDYAGGTVFPLPRGGVVRSANLTPDEQTGIGVWNVDFFISRFRQAASPEGRRIRVGRGDYNTVMPWTAYAGMSDNDLRAIYGYLRGLRPVRNSVETFPGAGAASKRK